MGEWEKGGEEDFWIDDAEQMTADSQKPIADSQEDLTDLLD